MQLMNSHRDDVSIDGKPGCLLMRDTTRALIKLDTGAVFWLPSDQVPPTAGERELEEDAQARIAMLRNAGALVAGEGRA